MTFTYQEDLIFTWTLWSFCFLITLARAITRWHHQKSFWADDICVFIAFLALTGQSAVITKAMPGFYVAADYMKAAAKNPFTPPPMPMDQLFATISNSLKLMFSHMLIFWTSLWFSKFSLLFFFRRLILGVPNYLRAWWLVFTIVTLLYVASILSNFLTCTPLKKYWSGMGCSAPDDLVRADKSIRFATGADVAADGLIMILPLHLVRKLKINTKQKIGLGMIFSLGLLIIAFAFARLTQVTKATKAQQTDPSSLANGPLELTMWSDIECAVAIIVANLPAFRYLLQQATGRSRGTPKYNGNYDRDGRKIVTIGGSGASKKGSAKTGQNLDDSLTTTLADLEEYGYGSEAKLKDGYTSSDNGIKKQVDYSVVESPRPHLTPQHSQQNGIPLAAGHGPETMGNLYPSHLPVPLDQQIYQRADHYANGNPFAHHAQRQWPQYTYTTFPRGHPQHHQQQHQYQQSHAM